jgi:hypothetical protein
MKLIVTALLAALILLSPTVSRAQYDNEDRQASHDYVDIEDGQLLKFLSYFLTPPAKALEWGLTRPLHYAATDTLLAPVLSGETEPSFFGQRNNATLLPPETFAPSSPREIYSNTTFAGSQTSSLGIQSTTIPAPPAAAPGQPVLH